MPMACGRWTRTSVSFSNLLDDLKIADNTIVVFTTDNGPERFHLARCGHDSLP